MLLRRYSTELMAWRHLGTPPWRHCNWLHAEQRRAELGQSSSGCGSRLAARRVVFIYVAFTRCGSPAGPGRFPAGRRPHDRHPTEIPWSSSPKTHPKTSGRSSAHIDRARPKFGRTHPTIAHTNQCRGIRPALARIRSRSTPKVGTMAFPNHNTCGRHSACRAAQDACNAAQDALPGSGALLWSYEPRVVGMRAACVEHGATKRPFPFNNGRKDVPYRR